MSETRTLDEGDLRRWLSLLGRPDRLADEATLSDILLAHGRHPGNGSAVDLGRSAVQFLEDTIERLRPPEGASREEKLPYQVLKTCFIDGSKLWQAANKLGMSERQMTRERSRAISLLLAELAAGIHTDVGEKELGREYRPEPIPAILGFMSRPAPTRTLRAALEEHRLVSVHGPPGVGKTVLVAELAKNAAEDSPVLWYRLRAGVNDSLTAFLFELGEHFRAHGRRELAAYMSRALPTPDPALATRLALKELDGSQHLLVLDDYHVVEGDRAVAGLLEEAAARLPHFRAVTISRHRDAGFGVGATYPVPALTRAETRALLTHLGVEVSPQVAGKIHSWTGGISQLVKLAASWLKTATEEEVAKGTDSLRDVEEVQAFLLESITELIGPDDRAILDAASIFRDRFTDDALSFVAQRTRGEVQDGSVRLVRSYIATRSREGDVAFFHTSVRDYVYDRLPLDRRQALHERAGIWYERQSQEKESAWHRRYAQTIEE